MPGFEGLTLFLFQLVFISLIIERNVAQVKALLRMDWNRPWPLVAVLFSGLIVFTNELPLLAIITGKTAEADFAVFVDRVVLTLWVSGGASAIINTMKEAMNKRKELHALKMGSGGLES